MTSLESVFLSSAAFDRGGQGSKNASILKKWATTAEDYSGLHIELPYFHVVGSQDGPKLIIVACIHGDELNGIPIIHELMELLDPQRCCGQIIALPIANMHGFHNQSRYMSDHRDLNRLFPGFKNGSEGSRYAYMIYRRFIKGADVLIDLHSASHNRWNYPHIRGNIKNETVRSLAGHFGTSLIIHSGGIDGSLRQVATSDGIASLLFEAGQTNRFEPEVAQIGVRGIWNILFRMKVVDYWPEGISAPEEVKSYYRKSQWLRSNSGGLFIAEKYPGDEIKAGERMGIIKSVFGEVRQEILATHPGRVIGFNLHPQVIPGRALYHIASHEDDLHH